MTIQMNVIIFDLDGVIIDSGRDIANAVNVTLKHFNRGTLPYDTIIGYVGKGAENLIRKSFKEYDEILIEEAVIYYKDYYLHHSTIETKLYQNVKEVLEYFKHKKLGLLTNKPEQSTLRILESLDIQNYFSQIVSPESISKMKPHPEGIFKILSHFNESTEKAIMVGDSYTDVEAGKSAGIYTCGVTYGLGSKEELIKSNPDYVIDDIGKLVGIIG